MDFESNSSNSDTEKPTVRTETPTKRKRLCKYNKAWETTYKWLRQANEKEARCNVCAKTFSVCFQGLSALKQHENTDYHSRMVQSQKTTSTITHFFTSSLNEEESDKVMASELTCVYHSVKHHLSYNSMDCILKLDKIIYNDSKIAKKVSCGRTKAEMLVNEVLAPRSIEEVLQVLNLNKCFFSVQTDASNIKNRKFFPLSIQYFTKDVGIQNKILDFIESADETAQGMFDMIAKSLSNLGVDLKYCSCFSADNTNANFGQNKSLFKKLKDVNKEILKANCHAHIVHNCVGHALDEFAGINIDVETLVFKIYSHFAQSAKRRDNLKDFYEFAEIHWREIIRHVKTRWLSLQPCIHRLLESWPAIISYFISAEDAKQVKKLIFLSKDDDSSYKVEIPLLFCDNILEIFQKTVKKLEGNKACAKNKVDEMRSRPKNLEYL
ncbi:unnamed protein product [Brassicogethes aeneus]|uniref:Uncharacterized protein n=1 Tax=Brassicogethes aeneus TaxID=1431903 RepID=A0A9P0BBX0_BRAAE|nr:unnamed protein product [Brassicogethes aeneus]